MIKYYFFITVNQVFICSSVFLQLTRKSKITINHTILVYNSSIVYNNVCVLFLPHYFVYSYSMNIAMIFIVLML